MKDIKKILAWAIFGEVMLLLTVAVAVAGPTALPKFLSLAVAGLIVGKVWRRWLNE